MPLEIVFDQDHTRAALRFSDGKGNLITAELVTAMRAALEDLSSERHLRLVTLEGAGADFSFGASVPEHAPGQIERVLPDMHALVLDLLALPAPTAALVQGRCLGGGFELALACDFIFAAETARIGLPEIALGVFPPAASVLLPQRVGVARATSAILSGQTSSAAAWRDLGLIELVATHGRLRQAVDDWYSRSLARWSAEALRHAVRAARAPIAAAAHEQLPVVERLYLQDLMRSRDAQEGIQAFLDKRKPEWQDE
jgi:cyclohexa-1,5-dienecarbonyl-CoA hydratase